MARRIEDDQKTFLRFFAGMWLLILALNLAWWGFVIWVIIQLLQHFGVI